MYPPPHQDDVHAESNVQQHIHVSSSSYDMYPPPHQDDVHAENNVQQNIHVSSSYDMYPPPHQDDVHAENDVHQKVEEKVCIHVTSDCAWSYVWERQKEDGRRRRRKRSGQGGEQGGEVGGTDARKADGCTWAVVYPDIDTETFLCLRV